MKDSKVIIGRVIVMFVVVVLVYTLKSTTEESNSLEDTKQVVETQNVEEEDATASIEDILLPEGLVVSNSYKSVTNNQGSEDDGKLFSAGFLGFINEDNYQVVADDYGYAHLSLAPIWSAGGGEESWVIIPKYKDAKIELIATETMSLTNGENVNAGDVIITGEESLIFYSNSTGDQSSVEVVVSYGDFSESFIPIASIENGAMSMPEYVWDISEYEPTDASMETE